MISSLAKVLIKIFVKGFYRNHAGSILFFFVGIFSYCFFIQTLNQTHLAPADRIIQNLLFVLTLLASPPLLVVVFIVWIGFSIKSYQYILSELKLPVNQFIFFSYTSLKKPIVFASWFIVQTFLSIPLLLFAFFTVVVGALYCKYLIPFVLNAFVMFLNGFMASLLTASTYKVERSQNNLFTKIGQSWRKPFYTLFLFQMMNKTLLTVGITKASSIGLMVGITYLLANIGNDFFTAGLMGLSISVAHALLLFQSVRFEMEFTPFIRNFPWPKSKIYLSWLATIGFLILPESLWLFVSFGWTGLAAALFALSLCVLLRSSLYKTRHTMRVFLYWVFSSFVIAFTGILFNALLPMAACALLASWLIVKRFYYRMEWATIIQKKLGSKS